MMTPSGPSAVLQIRFQVSHMTEHSLWRFSRALHAAINERQQQDLEPLIDDDVEWAIYGPIDMFPFLGSRHGKPAVLEVCRQIADNVRVHRFKRLFAKIGWMRGSSPRMTSYITYGAILGRWIGCPSACSTRSKVSISTRRLDSRPALNCAKCASRRLIGLSESSAVSE